MPGWSCNQEGEIRFRLFWMRVLGLAGFRTFLTKTTTHSQGLPSLAVTQERFSSSLGLHCPGPRLVPPAPSQTSAPCPRPHTLCFLKPQPLPVPLGSLPAPGAPWRQLEVQAQWASGLRVDRSCFHDLKCPHLLQEFCLFLCPAPCDPLQDTRLSGDCSNSHPSSW